jgi:DNA-binding NarL/FixJ family response regulator
MEDHKVKPRTHYRVLVVEDYYPLAETIKDMLLIATYDVVGVVATADDAVTSAQRLRPDLVLMDISLRGSRDGVDAASEIADRLGIWSLFVSGSSSPETESRAANFLHAGFIGKPICQRALIAAIDAVRNGSLLSVAVKTVQAKPNHDHPHLLSAICS